MLVLVNNTVCLLLNEQESMLHFPNKKSCGEDDDTVLFWKKKPEREERKREGFSVFTYNEPPVVLTQSSKDLPPPDSLAKCQSLVAPIIAGKGLL